MVGVELGGVSQAEAVAAIASASAGSLTDQRGLRTWWLGCAVYPSARRPGSPTDQRAQQVAWLCRRRDRLGRLEDMSKSFSSG